MSTKETGWAISLMEMGDLLDLMETIIKGNSAMDTLMVEELPRKAKIILCMKENGKMALKVARERKLVQMEVITKVS